MTLRRKRILLRVSAASLVLAAVGVCAAQWWPLKRSAGTVDADATPRVQAEVESNQVRRALAAEEAVWNRPLRKPLFDPPPPPPPDVVKVELPPIRARLLGTILEPGNSQAMISLPSGSVEFRTVGQLLGAEDGDAQIVETSASVVKVKRGEELTTLSVEASGQ